MIIKELDVKQSEVLFNQFCDNNYKYGFIDIDDDYKNIRNIIIEKWNECKSKVKKIKSYDFDLLLAKEIFTLFDNRFDSVTLASYNFWRYISLCVIPDLIYERWGAANAHFYKKTVRIYPYTLYWYIKLSWQGDILTTFNLLNKNFLTTDTILQCVERPGRMGIDIKYYNILMEKYCNTILDKANKYGDLFRNMLTLNTSRSFNLAIDFVNGGIDGYVQELLDESVGGILNGKTN